MLIKITTFNRQDELHDRFIRCGLVMVRSTSNGNIFRVTGPLCGEFTCDRWIPAQRPLTRSFDVFFDLHLNKSLSKQSCGWWFEKPSCSLWHHCNAKSTKQIHPIAPREGALGVFCVFELWHMICLVHWRITRNFVSLTSDYLMV